MKRILCFGDSNTWGHDPKDGSRLERRWTVMTGEELSDCEITEDGVCGRATTLRMQDDVATDGLKVWRRDYLQDNGFDLIIIMLGTNDTLNINNFTVEETAENLTVMIEEMRNSLGDMAPQILLISPIEISEDAMKHPVFSTLYSESSLTRSRRFAEVIEKVSREKNTHFLDASKFASPSPVDGIHMESGEHKSLANAITNKIKAIFDEENR